MSNAKRTARSFTIEREVDEYVSNTKGDGSASERANEMLRRAMREERYERLETEAEAFFAAVSNRERDTERAFQRASIRSITRD